MEIYKNAHAAPQERAKNLLAKMTPEEKLAQLQSKWGRQLMKNGTEFSAEKAGIHLKNGIGQITRPAGGTALEAADVAVFVNNLQQYLIAHTRLGIPALLHEECLAGWQTKGATIFPQSIGIGCSWDPEAAAEMTKAIRRQLKTINTHQALSPVLDIARDPRWGRTEETYGEDPFLVASMACGYINGLQGDDLTRGVGATLKHFAGYSASEGGLNWAPARIPERELREVYLYPFEAAVRTVHAFSVMNAYHEIDGIPCGANKRLLTEILRNEWGFDGIVVSDYEAILSLYNYHKAASSKDDAAWQALDAGIDVELPEWQCYSSAFLEKVSSGEYPSDALDTAVLRVLTAKFQLGIFEHPLINDTNAAAVLETEAERQLARETARKTIVLLKNDNNLLPLKKNIKKLAVIGPNAASWRNLMGDYSYPSVVEFDIAYKLKQETGTVTPEQLELPPDITVHSVSVLEGIKNAVSGETEVFYARGCSVLGGSTDGFYEAVDAATRAEAVVMVMGGKSGFSVGCTSGEERDRLELDLPGVQEDLVKAVHGTGKPVILILINGRPYAIEWIQKNIPAIVEAWIPGEEGGNAVADVLFGDYNPGGKLCMTFPRKVGQVPVYYGRKPSAGRSHFWDEYVDGPTGCLFPFGYGLSYTEFSYSGLEITDPEIQPDGTLTGQFTVTNSGKREGDEIVQIYVHDLCASVTRPVKELKGFKRIHLATGQAKTVEFTVPAELLAFYNRDMQLTVEPGAFALMIGSSSGDIRLTTEFSITGTIRNIAVRKEYFSIITVK